MPRISTAPPRSGKGEGYAAWLQGEFPSEGRVLNLGSGGAAWVGPGSVVNIDHVMMPRSTNQQQVVADAVALPFRPGTFAGILAKDVLEHLADPVGVLAMLHELGADGALLVASVPRAIPRAVWDDPTHVRGFTSNAVRTAMRLSGWELLTLTRIGGFPGAGRLGLTPHLEKIMKIPGFGHRFGVNWLARARRSDRSPG
jgi:SAM-dependent methyltransferase